MAARHGKKTGIDRGERMGKSERDANNCFGHVFCPPDCLMSPIVGSGGKLLFLRV